MASVDPLTPITTSPANDNNATAPTNIQSIASPNDTSTTSAAVTPQKNSGNTSSSATPMETEIAFPQPVPIKISNDVIKQEPAPTLSASASISTPLTPAKRPRHKPSERRELLEKAVRDVQEQNISMRKAASRYNLAKSSLCDYVRKNRIVLPNNRCKQPSVGSLNNTSNNNNSGSSITGVDNNHLNSSSAAGSSNNSAPLGLDATKQLLNHSGPFNFALETLGSQVSQAGSVITRLESPWNNVSGLPTQVPMQNWSSPHAKSISVLSQPPQPMASAASPPKVNSPTTNFSVVSSSSGFIYASTPTSVNETVSENTNSNINNPSSSTTAATIPALSQFTLSASDALLTASPLSRSLASIYASPQVQSSPIGQHQQPQQSFLSMQPPPPPAQVGTQLASNPLIFPTTPADQNALLKTLRDLMNVATKTVVPQQQLQSQQQQQQQFPQPQLLPNLFFSLPLDFQSAMPDPSSSASSNAVTTSSTSSVGSSDDLLRKIHLSNCFAPLVAPPGSAQPTAGALINTDSVAAVSVIARFQMACARELIDFINKSPSPFHVVRNVAEILIGAGFRELSEQEPWKLATNDCVFVTKNSTSLFAIAVGGAYKPGDGFSIIGAHTDSPGLRLKPISERVREGFVELGVQTYGAGIWHTWFDRDLTLAGRCILSNPTTKGLQERLVQFERPLVCIPSLAIHLDRDVNKSFSPDPEKHLAPIISTTIMDQLNTPVDGAAVPSGHPAGLMRLLASELDCAPTDIVDLELCLADTQPAAIGGLHEEFVHAPRLDNQFCAYTSVRALVNSLRSLKEDSRVRVVCLYDHEEIGSRSMQGANSVYTECLFRRITEALATGAVSRTATPMETADMSTASSNNNTTTTTTTTTAVSASANGGERCLFERTMAKSFFLSADQAHAVHPSYPEKHEPAHKPGFHQGIVIKHHCSQRYATNGITSAIVKEVARLSNVPIQEFVVRQDSPCGSTIGPIVASQLGVMTADVGGAQLAMHSVRETTCTSSVGHAVTLFTGFYEHLGGILANFQTLGK